MRNNLTYHTLYHAHFGNVKVPDQYVRYYRKGICESVNAGYMTYAFKPAQQSVVDFNGLFESTSHRRYADPNEKLCHCLNSKYSTINYIREFERNSFFVSEALIDTISTNDLCDKVNTNVINRLPAELRSLTFGQTGCVNDGDPLFDIQIAGFIQTEFDRSKDILPLFCIWIPVYETSKPDQNLICRDLETLIRQNGYEIASVELCAVKVQPLRESIAVMLVEVEARYNDIDVQLQNVLYHVTPSENLQNIVEHGLVPHSNSTEFKYPARVYLFNKHSIQTIEDYGASKVIKDSLCTSRRFCIVQIDGKKIRESSRYKSGDLVFYADAAFSDDFSDDAAVFTYDTVPKEFLIDKVMVYELDESGDLKTIENNGMKQPDVKVMTLRQACKLKYT